MFQLLYHWKRYPLPTVQEAGWVPELIWVDVFNIAPTRSQSQTVQSVALKLKKIFK
jgi:hypothetical protein